MDIDLINQLRETSLRSATDFVDLYTSNEDQIIKSINDFDGIKSEFYCNDFYQSINSTKFLSLYADLTSFFMMPDKVKEHVIHYYDEDHVKFIDRNITFPAETLDGFIPKPQDILPCYTTPNDKDLKEFSTRLKPLSDNGKFLLRPIRTIILENHPSNKNVDRVIFYASSDTLSNDWQIKTLNEKNSYVIDNGLKAYHSKALYEITLPYLNNLSIANLAKIINDETDLLATFRATLKDLMLSSVTLDTVQINEIRNDKIRPQIETINRKFKSIQNIHRISIGASVAAITLTLVGISTGSGINFQSLFSPAFGTLGMLASKLRYQAEEDKLKDNSYFLLWKISKANTSKILKQF